MYIGPLVTKTRTLRVGHGVLIPQKGGEPLKAIVVRAGRFQAYAQIDFNTFAELVWDDTPGLGYDAPAGWHCPALRQGPLSSH